MVHSSLIIRYRLYTGPTLVVTMAARLRTVGFEVTCEGTEHIYFESSMLAVDVLSLIRDKVGSGFTARDLNVVGLAQCNPR